MIWNDFLTIVNEYDSFLITSHLSPDGDCVGTQLAMYWFLDYRGKDVVIYNHDTVPWKFSFLKNSDKIKTTHPGRSFDVLIVLDSSNPQRLGWEIESISPKVIVNIDHHRDNSRFGDFNFVSKGAASGEILYTMFNACQIQFPEHVAEDLYVAIMTDTGGFRFSNTNSNILRICADLAEKGAHCADIFESVYASNSKAGMCLLSRIWSTIDFHLDDRVCSMSLALNLVEELGAAYSDSEGMADLTITVASVNVGVFVKHTPTQTHFSLRSKGIYDVGKMAKRIYGGGGHCNAAGCTIEEPVETAFPKMLAIIKEGLD